MRSSSRKEEGEEKGKGKGGGDAKGRAALAFGSSSFIFGLEFKIQDKQRLSQALAKPIALKSS